MLPNSIKDVIGRRPISELEKITGRSVITRYIEFELIKLSALVSVGGNLNDMQVQFIASQLVELFPNESLGDFKICFQRGCIGQYGEIYRMDGIVLRKWMEQYLEEKYQIIEQRIKATKVEKPEQKQYTLLTEKFIWHNPCHLDGFLSARHYLKKLSGGTKVPSLTDKEIKEEGQEQPKHRPATDGYAWFNVRGIMINAITQEHAEEIAAKALKEGIIEEIENE